MSAPQTIAPLVVLGNTNPSLCPGLKCMVVWRWLLSASSVFTAAVVAVWPETLALILGTFVSEDLTCVSAGLLIQDRTLGWFPGVAGCLLGIYFGDLGLWLLGRIAGQRVLRWPWVRRRISAQRLERAGRCLDERGWIAIFAARFLPGTRLPLYLAAGMLGRNGGRFALWTLVAAAMWTPLLVGGVVLVSSEIVVPLQQGLGAGWVAVLVAAGMLFFTLRLARAVGNPQGRATMAARIARVWRWEFWPTWLFYLPVLPWIGWLMVRYRSLTVWTAANPGIPQGGVVGESKFDILTNLPAEWIVPSALLAPGEWHDRLHRFVEIKRDRGWVFPLILKPDVGQRGAGVKLARSMNDVAEYLKHQPDALIVQAYHPGPFEAGIFYVRIPGEPSGRIFSVTDKRFPELLGDGQSTLEQLIWAHPRFRMQAQTFLIRHEKDLDRVLARGESFRLAVAGNHCQGTMFLDGAHLITPELERRVDDMARHFDGFFFGRFDVRYSNVEAFKAGRDLAIVELNGVTSESTNIYDPGRSLLHGYGTLYRQWSLLFRIGDANRRLGQRPASLGELLKSVSAHLLKKPTLALAD
ncbi:MAG: VTT domain-containing protein [Gemmataceae bacterium]|nr:VTT domain-containing protein [Gemmataceae bacterium]